MDEIQHINPCTGKPQATVMIGGYKEIDMAAREALQAQKIWIGIPANERRDKLFGLCALVKQHKQEFVSLSALESGIPVKTGSLLLDSFLDWGSYFAGWADKIQGVTVEIFPVMGFDYTRMEPYKVIGVIILLLLYGLVIALDAGLPPGLINVIPGEAEAGSALIKHPDIGKVTYTGGGEVARKIMILAAEVLNH